jgi:outer membrane protein assembly factor BamB
MLHTMYVSNGQEPKPAVPFLTPNVAARGFIVVNDVAYAATVACSGGASSLIALDLKSGATNTWNAPSEIAGQEGPAFGPDGTLYVSTIGGDLFALDPKTLEVKDTLKSGEPFASSPVIFQYRQKVLGVAAQKDDSLLLFDTKSLGGEDHKTPLFKTKPDSGQNFTSATVSSWMDDGARRWVLLPAKASGKAAIAAWQVKEQNGSLSLELGWTSREIPSPSAAMIINGVVFAASNADPADTGNKRKPPSIIYALDGKTGKELWSSGKAIASSAHNGSLSGGAGQIYLGADDGNLYAFGAWIEREDITP